MRDAQEKRVNPKKHGKNERHNNASKIRVDINRYNGKIVPDHANTVTGVLPSLQSCGFPHKKNTATKCTKHK